MRCAQTRWRDRNLLLMTIPSPLEEKPWVECQSHGDFLDWLEQSGGTVLATTYNSGKLALVSCVDGQLWLRIHKFARPMGMAIGESRLALAVQESILLFDLRLPDRPNDGMVDAVLTLHAEHVTGKLDAHDITITGDKLYFANTRYNCISRPSTTHRFARCWQPEFISEIAAGDRCHLNGVGSRDGRPEVVTAFCESDQRRGWREQDRFTGGILIDMRSKQIIARGLCMPHSPRWHHGKWWFCNSGLGTLCTLDMSSGHVDEVCVLPGFVRGLWFVGHYALVGLSRIRKEHVLDPSPVSERLRKAKSGVAVVDIRAGRLVGLLEFVRGGREVYDVSFLPSKQRIKLIP